MMSAIQEKKLIDDLLAVGDVVRFRGGGSLMVIEKIERDQAICVFSLGGRQRVSLKFLKRVPEERHWWDSK